ncbi:DNA methyltransferase [Brachybacterium paraconglomeratum]
MAGMQIDRGVVRRQLTKFAQRWSENIAGWTESQRGHSERSYAQTFWGDLLRQFGVIPERISLFEHEADRATTGNRGYVDVFWSGVFIGEAKSLGKDLEAAERQARDYLGGGTIAQHEFPRFSICTDFARFRVTRLGDPAWTVTFELHELPDYVDQLMFLAGHETVTKQQEEEASVEASKVMASLYKAMVGDEADEPVGDEAPRSADEEDVATQRASVFLTRLLFLLYGDDAGLWEEDLFHRFVLHDTTPENLGPQLQALFAVLDSKQRRNVPASMAKFPYVNGSLYADPMPIEFFTDAMREAVLAACRFRWTRISPAVFGSMFQMVKKREFRRAGGEHYTTEENIAKTVGPLFLDELQAEADRLCRNKDTSVADLRTFQEKLASLTLVDPACGSGNFLTVAYGRLRDIETQIIVKRRERQKVQDMALDVSLDTKVTIDQFHGIELSWWPAKIAETAMFLVDHQANRRLALAAGNAPERLPITITAHIHHANALTTPWEDLIATDRRGPTYLFGNPPFLGHDSRTTEQAAELRAVWGRKDIGRLDYVTAWHKKSADFFASRQGEFAYVATNSITQGDQVPRLFGPLQELGWHVKFAHRTFAWTSEAPGKASVHCVIVGFTRHPEGRARLWDYRTPDAKPEAVKVSVGVNAYLVDGPEVLATAHKHRVSPQLPPVTFGSTPRDGGNLIVKPAQYETFANDPVAAKYLRKFVGAEELLHGKDRWCLWLINLEDADYERSPLLAERIDAVRRWREDSPSTDANAAAATPHLFWWRSQPTVDYLCIPSVVSERRRYFTAMRLPADTISSNAVFTAPDPDGLAFAAVSSSMFIAWQKATGGRLESRLRFSSTLTWNNFPLPALTDDQHAAMVEAGRGVLAARELRPERTLAQAYSQIMDDQLVKAHQKLDRVVDRVFGAPRLLTSERQRLEYLFASYANMTADESLGI